MLKIKGDDVFHGGSMGIKQALFLGGAVLLLAACSDATSPDTQMRKGGAAASAKSKPASDSTATPSATSTSSSDCWNYVVASGRDSTCAEGQ